MFTALDAPTMTRTAKITQRTGPRLIPMASDRVNDRAVDVCAQLTANSAKASAHANCAADLPRLFRPRLRRWWILM